MPQIAGPPYEDSLVETRPPQYLARPWILWLQDAVVAALQQAPAVTRQVRLLDQHSAIGLTAIPRMAALGSTAIPLPAGVFRVSWYVRVTTPDGVSSSVAPTISWTESGVGLSASGAAVTGDTTGSTGSGSVIVVADAKTIISYATSYASNTAAKMGYRVTILLETLYDGPDRTV